MAPARHVDIEAALAMTAQNRAAAAYNALLRAGQPVLRAYTLWRRYGQGKSAASYHGQWGRVPRDVVSAMTGPPQSVDARRRWPRIWLHAVSVGEAVTARPVARALRARLPGCRIGLSVTTDTGYRAARAALEAGEVDALFYFPVDARKAVRRALAAIDPHAFLTVETELWPNFLQEARRRGTRTFLVNGRVSDNLLKQAPRLGGIWRWMMGNLDAALMRSEFDAGRLREIGDRVGAGPAVVVVTGDVKLDTAPAPAAPGLDWRALLGIAPGAPLWVAGSTHAGEEQIVARVYKQLKQSMPALRLVIAPRHVERAGEVARGLESESLAVLPRSRAGTRPITTGDAVGESRVAGDAVVVLDSVGELTQLYGVAQVAFVGGTLIERGGHNLLEPVLQGAPVVFGRHVANFREAAALALRAGVGVQVAGEAELAEAVRSWLEMENAAAIITQRVNLALVEHRGAAARVAEFVASALEA